MELIAQSRDALDWPVITERLSRHAHTTRGRSAALSLPLLTEVGLITTRFEEVAEVAALADNGDAPPVGAVLDVAEPVSRTRRGTVLLASELRDIGAALEGLDRLRKWVDQRMALCPRLRGLVEPIQVDLDLRLTLIESFDATGELSAERYPVVGALREKMKALKERIRAFLDEVVRGETLADVLMDRFVTERQGRFVIPVKIGSRRGVGIVHGTSQSGETAYVEPAEVVERTNELKETEAALAREERRILAQLSMMVSHQHDEILLALDASVDVDLAVARHGLGVEWRGTIPRVGEEGVIILFEARHPVLQLRGVEVVPNDLSIDGSRQGLILTGPNTGGKTVAMKTMGLAALLVRAAVPIPAGAGSRVDVFDPVLADVGDMQTVEGDLSTFSGHLLVLRTMIEAAGPRALILLDEIGMGTDPAQGAALARAVIEALADRGARVVVTTHFAQLKGLAAADRRFWMAAVQYAEGRPTYRLQPGMAGQSHAFATAERMHLPQAVVDRAREVLGAGERELAELMAQMEAERELLHQEKEALRRQAGELRARAEEARRQAQRLEERRQKLEGEVAQGFERRLRQKEAQVKALIAALQENPNLRLAGKTLDELESVRAEVKTDLAPIEVTPPPPPLATVEEGAVVSLPRMGGKGRVVRVLSRGLVEVEVGSLRLKVRQEELGFAPPPPPRPKPVELPPEPPAKAGAKADGHLRLAHNTLDLRGFRVDEGLLAADLFVDQLTSSQQRVGFILHGHGTGAMKKAVRDWARQTRAVEKARPASVEEGGDAYTLIELR
jgi:DNA mismatch repair protein MutS2